MPFGLGVGDRENDALAQVVVGAEYHIDSLAVGSGGPAFDLGTAARRAVGSTATLPSAPIVPDRNVIDEICPSPTARRLRMNRQPLAGALDWSGWRTMLGLNRADASNEYSCRKYAPIRQRCVCSRQHCGSSASSISRRASEDLEQVAVTAFKFSSTR